MPGMSEAGSSESQQASTNVKETIESILVAFILAFIFRAFVVEAFVIPTGSMAPTLLGAHMTFRCPDCGYVFTVNYSLPNGDSDEADLPASAMVPDDIYCPNCGYHITSGPELDRNGLPVKRELLNSEGSPIADAQGNPIWQLVYPYGAKPQPVHYGDRILVLKYAFLFNEPHRWDVVVFKSPAEPEKYHYTQNFIKRLVGLPGETLMVLDGDIYTKDAGGAWQIQRKPWPVQQALWRVVYDNDYYPRGLPRPDRAKPWTQPWEKDGGTGWNLGHDAADGRTFRFDNAAGQGTVRFNAFADAGSQTTNDYLVYDIPQNQRHPGGGNPLYGDQQRSIVSDLMLTAWYQRQSGNGPLKLRLTKRRDSFVAEIDSDSVTLWHTRPDGSTVADAGPVKLSSLGIQPGAPLWLQFLNVDYKVTLRINGKPVLWTTPREYSPNVPRLLREYNEQIPAFNQPPTIEMIAADQSCLVSHIGLWRDIYYTDRGTLPPMTWGTPDHPVHLHRRGEERPDGGVYDDNEYFVMGDNSLISGDARYWDQPIDLPNENLFMQSGRVPGRFMLGKAFFVYWPAGYQPFARLPALIPDFGDMRLIH
jgi:signal peptidase I